jgi:two-component system KDP operon response regulator KdpE
VRRALRVTLSGFGFKVIEAARGEEAVPLVRLARPDAVLLDVDMPGMGGVEACRRMHGASPRVPILMLTAMDGENDKVMALDAGADDYITKPFRLRELLARLRSAVRRRNAKATNQCAPIHRGQLELDQAKHRVLKRGLPLHLTPKEFKLLCHLMLNAGKPVPYIRLLDAVWGPGYGDRFVHLRMIVSQLRRKIEDDHLEQPYLQTVHQFGYKFVDQKSLS